MPHRDPIAELVPAYVTLLGGVATVYDEMVPEEVTSGTYIVLTEKSANDIDDKNGNLQECIMTIECVVKGQGTGGKVVRVLATGVEAVLNRDAALTTTNFQVATTRLISRQSFSGILSDTQKIFRVILRFSHIVNQIS